jgi:hypothetical protein
MVAERMVASPTEDGCRSPSAIHVRDVDSVTDLQAERAGER